MTRYLRRDFARYNTWLFDCDGVLLDSNRLKTDAFRRVALEFGNEQAAALVRYHVAHGGVSRYVKFRHFQEQILGVTFDEALQQRLLDGFSAITRQLLLECPLTEGCLDLLGQLPRGARRHVVSGGDEAELQFVFAERGLEHHFTSICGSPRPKREIVDTLRPTFRGPVVFFGDSRADHEAALYAGAHFVFVSRYSEFEGWQEYFARPLDEPVELVSTLAELLTS